MKKGLFSILAGALLVVGCQNYDDQFSNIESQITALASQVAGLSQVQSDLTALGNTVNSLQSSVADTVDAALADGLADIDTAVASLEAATATAASSEDVAAIATAVAANQEDLQTILDQSSVFSGAVVVNSIATLDAYHSMGDALAIVANSVTINPSADMDATKLKELADVFKTITGDLSVTSAASTIAELVFNNLTGAASLTLEQAGGYHFPVLQSASTIYLSDRYESTITRVNFPALASVASMGTDSRVNGIIEFTKATGMSFAALPRYGSSLSFTTKKGKTDDVATLDISALKDVAADGTTVSALNLSISGPNSVNISTLDGKAGTLTLQNVLTATVTDYDGDIVVNGGVENFTSNNVVALSGTMSDVTVLDITGVLDPNDTTDKSGPAIDLDARADLINATLAGNLASVDIQNNGNIETLTITANVNNGAIDIDTNSDLETITLTGAKASGVTINANNSLISVTVDAIIQKTLATAATLDGSIVVTNNTDMETLTVSGANVAVLTITGNVDLETITGTGLTSIGATLASNNVTISNNKLSASIAQDLTNVTSCTDCADFGDNDLGLYSTASKMETLKVYLQAVADNASASAAVYFDTVESTTDATGVETTAEVTGQVAGTKILVKSAAVGGTASLGEIAAKRAFIVDVSTGSTKIGIHNAAVQTAAGSGLFAGATSSAHNSVTVNSNLDLLIADLKSTASVARFSAYDITLDAKRGGNSTQTVSLVFYATGNATTTQIGERHTVAGTLADNLGRSGAVSATNYGFGADDYLTFSVGSNSVTATGATLAVLKTAIMANWAAKYGVTGTASSSAVATLTTVSTSKIKATMLDKGTAGYAQAVTIAATAGTVTATNGKNVGWIIGATTLASDNPTIDTDVVVTFLSDGTGTLLNKVSDLVTLSIGTLTWVELFTNKLTNAANPAAGIYPGYLSTVAGIADGSLIFGSADVVAPENGVAATAPTTAAVDDTRVHWFN